MDSDSRFFRWSRIGAGFTLVEMLVALAIVGILTAASYPSYRNYLRRGDWTRVKSVMFGLASDLEEHYLRSRDYQNAPWQSWLSRYGLVTGYDLRLDLQSDSYKIIALPRDQATSSNPGLVLYQDGRQSCIPENVQDCWEVPPSSS